MPKLAQSITVATAGQLARGADWRLRMVHDRPDHLLIWTTRGQGRMLLDGVRRGLGTHNAIFVPAGTLFAMELGRQTVMSALVLPATTEITLPEMSRLLRIRNAASQTELTALLDAAMRESLDQRPLCQEALEAHARLVSVWLRRQVALEEHLPRRLSAAEKLSRAFCALVSADYGSGAPMATYAGKLGVTPTHLTRAVKAATGKTAADLLTERVVYAAQCLLAETNEPANAIARHLGFGSAAYFTRFIQQHTGLTPTKFRQNHRTTP